MATETNALFLIDEASMAGLEKLGALLNKPSAELVNDAVREYVARHVSEVEVDLSSTLEDLRLYRQRDPYFKRDIAEFVAAETATTDDPAEGVVIAQTGPAREKILKLLLG